MPPQCGGNVCEADKGGRSPSGAQEHLLIAPAVKSAFALLLTRVTELKIRRFACILAAAPPAATLQRLLNDGASLLIEQNHFTRIFDYMRRNGGIEC